MSLYNYGQLLILDGTMLYGGGGSGMSRAIAGVRLTAGTRSSSARRVVNRNFGTSLSFTGTTSNNMQIAQTLPTTEFTVSFWYKAKAPMNTDETVFEQAGSFLYFRQGANNMQAYAYINASSDFAGLRRLRFNNLTMLGSNIKAGSNKGAFDNLWHHRVVVVYVSSNRGKLDEYQDGEKIGVTSIVDYTGDPSTPSGNLYIGKRVATSTACNALLDNIRIFNRQLTATEISDLYYSDIIPTGVQAEYLLNEGSGSAAVDSSGNGNNGSITGAVYSTDVRSIARVVVS